MVTIIKRPNGGGTWSHWRRVPACAATQVNAIQTKERKPTKTDAHFASNDVAPLRRQAAEVPHTSAATSSVGIITKAATAGSNQEYFIGSRFNCLTLKADSVDGFTNRILR